mmetsp:Transcript_23524/g.48950  ORF Transcript_23524/g.48950 Transcript_23524/m.48950 type:complete len:459 (+) Transcript_23524:199-1575(+)
MIRLRTNVGVYRVPLSPPLTTSSVMSALAASAPGVVVTSPMSFSPYSEGNEPKDPLVEGSDYTHRLSNGLMIYTFVSPESPSPGSAASSTAGPKKASVKVNKDGSISALSYAEANKDSAFRPGMMPLSSMKKHWTLAEFMEMDDTFVFKIKGGGQSSVMNVRMEQNEAQSFQAYMRDQTFQTCRMGYLYGTVGEVEDVKGDDGKTVEGGTHVNVEFVYEPQQTCEPEGFEIADTEEAEKEQDLVDMIATSLGFKKVGWIFGHPPREDGFIFSGEEILTAAELQLEDAGGVGDTSFMTIKCTCNEEGNATFDAFTLSKQCMEMVAEGALELSPSPGFLTVNETFTAMVEGKPASRVDNTFWLQNVAIKQGEGSMRGWFPKVNRDGSVQTHDALKSQLSQSGKKGFKFEDCLLDFQALLYLTKFLAKEDVSAICEGAKVGKVEEGWKVLVASMAGMDGSY